MALDDERNVGRRVEDAQRVDDLDAMNALVVTQNRLIDEQTKLIYAHRRKLREAAVGYLILFAALAASLYLLEHRDTARLHQAATAACDRENVLRGQANINSLAVYGALYSGERRERALAKHTKGKERTAHVLGVIAYHAYSSVLRHTDPTDCDLAVNYPDSYQPPPPEPYHPSDIPPTFPK